MLYTTPVPNKLRRYYGAGYLHFITTSCYQRMPLLAAATNLDAADVKRNVSNPKVHTFEVPTLAKYARMGHPQSWRCLRKKKGWATRLVPPMITVEK